MRRIFISLTFILTLSMFGGLYLVWGPGGILSPGPHMTNVTLNIEKGSNLATMSNVLAAGGVMEYPWGFVLATLLLGKKGELKAGEYLIPARARPLDIVRLMVSGKVIVHQLTFPEGLTVVQMVDILKAEKLLTGTIEKMPEEGSLLPETYSFLLGDSREKIIHHMQLALTKAVDKIWKNRQEDSPIKTPQELVTLASIVEKETGVAHERPRVAAVFLNRLKMGMRLQSDPTVVYGLTLGQKPLGRLLTFQDLKNPTEYNTYVISSLPPKPIACPGRKSLEAVINPSEGNDTYFVANGSGGHSFSNTYTDHLKRVKEWRQIQQK